MDSHKPDPAAENLALRREYVRRSVLRANRAVAVILAILLILGGVLVAISLQAGRDQQRAENAEQEATERLWKASLAQARAESLGTQAGHRAAALEAVKTAARIRPSLELRNEAISAMGLRDIAREKEWPLKPNAYGFNFDPDLKYYLVRYTERTLSMYRMEDNTLVREFPAPIFLRPTGHVGDFMFSATGKYVIIRYNNGPLVLWERETGVIFRVIGADLLTQNYSWPPTFTSDDRTMCLATSGREGAFELYDLPTGTPRRLPQLPKECAYSGYECRLSMNPAGTLLAHYQGATVSILDATTGMLRQKVSAASNVQYLGWNEQGDRLAFGCDNHALFVWEAKSGRVLQMGGNAVFPWVQKFSPDGSLLLTSGTDGVTRLWDVSTARLMSKTNDSRVLAFSRDGRHIAGGLPGKTVGVWRLEESSFKRLVQGTVQSRATAWQTDLSSDGRWLVWAPPSWASPLGYEVIDLSKDTPGRFVAASTKVAAGFRPMRDQMWVAGPGGLVLKDLTPAIPGTERAEAGTQVPLPRGIVPLIASFSTDGNRAVVVGTDGSLTVVDLAAPEKFVTLDGKVRTRVDMAGPGSPTGGGTVIISPDSRWVIAAMSTDGGNPLIWNAQTGKLVKRLPTSWAVATFSPDGRWLATTGATSRQIWETGTWKLVHTRQRPDLLTYFGSVCFNADGSILAGSAGTDSIELTDTKTGEELATLDVSEIGSLHSLRFSGDGSRLVAGGVEGRMLVMDLNTMRKGLADLGLNWPLPDAPKNAATSAAGRMSGWTPALLIIIPVGIAAVLGTAALRRQGRLTGEFVKATELASERERELAAEREVSELKSRFVTTVSHEFRTPLGITMSAIELLRHYEDRLPIDERRQLFDDIHSATRNMAGLMEQVLVLGRVDAGKLAYRPAPLDLDNLARKLIDESLSATNRKCPVEWTAVNDLSGGAADEALLRHIFSNLLSNGVKYSPAGSTVRFTGRRDGTHVVFTVQDQGIGIPEADLPRLFEAFHRGGNVGDIPGTGLGLVIIKRCVDLHLGTIEVKSTPGEGTLFTVRLPAW